MNPTRILILLVEDEILIQDLLKETLEEGGFAVIIANNGDEALQVLNDPDKTIRALVTDVNLSRNPDDLKGWQVAKHARELSAELPVVYMTGDSGHHWASEGVPNSVLVAKPFAPAQIVTAVSQLLNAGNTAGAS